MRRTTKFFLSLMAVVILSATESAQAFIPPTDQCIDWTAIIAMNRQDALRSLLPTRSGPEIVSSSSESHCMDLNKVTVVTPPEDTLLTRNNINKVLPTNMTPGSDPILFYTQLSTGIQNKLTQDVADYLLQAPAVKDAGVTKTVETVQKAASQSMAFPTPSGVTHKFALNFRYAERTATASYEGFFSLTAMYVQASNNMLVVLSKEVAKNTTVSVYNLSPVGQFNQSGNLSIGYTF